jgi:hypothetical protein
MDDEQVPHLEMLPQLWTDMQEVLTKLKYCGSTSLWMKKNRLFGLIGKQYADVQNGKNLFWIHLRILAFAGYLPRYTSRDKKGQPTCFNDKTKKLTTKWCQICKVGLHPCNNCFRVIKFIGTPTSSEIPNPTGFTDFTIHHSSSSVIRSNFKGPDFTKYLLPLVLFGTNPICFLPKFIQRIIDVPQQDNRTKVQALLDAIYGKQVIAQKQLWLAPTHDDNTRISLTKKIKLNKHNTVGIQKGKYYVWGFNCNHALKWHHLQLNDYVLFGNTWNGFNMLGKVQSKFIWINNEASNVFEYFSKAGIWLYGFTIVFEPVNFLIPGSDMQEILFENSKNGNTHYQTQTKLKGSILASVKNKLRQQGVVF